MNKNFKLYLSVWAIFLALFNVVAFVSPAEIAGADKFSGAFWPCYVLITLAFVGQLACSYVAFKEENLRKLFYNIPLITISCSGLVLTLIVGGLFMFIPALPVWLGTILCFAILAFTAVSVIQSKLAADTVAAVDDKIKVKTFFIKSLAVDADGLVARASSEIAKAECKKVYEAVRYSDPMSNEALASVESAITLKFSVLSDAVAQNNDEAVVSAAKEVMILVNDRNKKCMLLK